MPTTATSYNHQPSASGFAPEEQGLSRCCCCCKTQKLCRNLWALSRVIVKRASRRATHSRRRSNHLRIACLEARLNPAARPIVSPTRSGANSAEGLRLIACLLHDRLHLVGPSRRGRLLRGGTRLGSDLPAATPRQRYTERAGDRKTCDSFASLAHYKVHLAARRDFQRWQWWRLRRQRW